MIETIFAIDGEETPGMPGMPQEGGDEGMGGGDMPAPEQPESRFDGEEGGMDDNNGDE